MDMDFHQLVGERTLTLDASLGGEAAMSFYDPVMGYTGCPFEAVDVLGEEFVKKTLGGEERNEGMG